MIKKVAKTFYNLNNIKVSKLFSTHAPAPTKLQKVEEVTVKFNVKNAQGQWEHIHAFVGQSFLDALLRMRVKGTMHTGLCLGHDFVYKPHLRPHDPYSEGPNCGICRIVLKDNWYHKINQETEGVTPQEADILQVFTDMKTNTRLACCVPVEAWMQGCTFEIYTPPQLSQLTELH